MANLLFGERLTPLDMIWFGMSCFLFGSGAVGILGFAAALFVGAVLSGVLRASLTDGEA